MAKSLIERLDEVMSILAAHGHELATFDVLEAIYYIALQESRKERTNENAPKT